MAKRRPNPERERQRELAYKWWVAGHNFDIDLAAEKVGVSRRTVIGWRSYYGWGYRWLREHRANLGALRALGAEAERLRNVIHDRDEAGQPTAFSDQDKRAAALKIGETIAMIVGGGPVTEERLEEQLGEGLHVLFGLSSDGTPLPPDASRFQA
jgi:hypothetical protein